MDPHERAEIAGRPLPFIMQVAGEWIDVSDIPFPNDPALLFRDRVPLTGNLNVTAGGSDVEFSDIGVAS
ncbi:hypothetical protein [Streptomyces sp. NPDC093600]|uniref:hypothetical protein n=1 Tax=Streptomyces sp. NPDC093600 TaxID=3366047 RepID=UPI003800F337